MIIPELTFKTDFYRQGFTNHLYDVERSTVRLFEGKDMGDAFWFLSVGEKIYKICPTFGRLNGILDGGMSRDRAIAMIEDLQKQIKSPVDCSNKEKKQPTGLTLTIA